MHFSKQKNRRKARSHHGHSDSPHNNSLYEATCIITETSISPTIATKLKIKPI